MTDRKVTHVTVLKHYDDGSTEQMAKINPATVAAILAAGLAVMPTQQRPQSRYNYINADACPTHGPWKAVPAGVSKNTNKPYPAFWACDQPQGEERCTNKPGRDWVETHPPDKAQNDWTQVDVAPSATSTPSGAPGPSGGVSGNAGEYDDLPF